MITTLQYNWVGHNFTDKSDKIYIVTLRAPFSVAKLDGKSPSDIPADWDVVTKWGRRRRDLNLNTQLKLSHANYFDAVRLMSDIVRAKQKGGYEGILTPYYKSAVNSSLKIEVEDVAKYFENDEVAQEDLFVEEVICTNNERLESVFDLEVSYSLTNPLPERKLADIKGSDMIQVCDKFGNERYVKAYRFRFVLKSLSNC